MPRKKIEDQTIVRPAFGRHARDKIRSSEVVHLTPARKLRQLLAEGESLKASVGALVEEHRDSIGNAIQHNHLHKAAFADLKRFYKMRGKPEKLAHHWDMLLAYMDASGLIEIIESVQNLPMEAPAAEAAE